jgi:peptidoglycan hydrolase-like protein with peptidoglycan-binding domain
VAAVVLLSALTGGDDGTKDTSTVSPPSVIDTTSTSQPLVIETIPAVEKTTIAEPINRGASGPEVQALQERLIELGFAPGMADGVFGEETSQAVWAYKKLILGMSRQELQASDNASQITPEMWLGLQDDIAILPRRPQGTGTRHMEVYLKEQVGIVFHDDRPVLIAHISSGELDANGQPVEFCEVGKFDTDDNGQPLDPPEEKAICALAKTPGGRFDIDRIYEGKRVSALGGMTNPVYFNYGIAVHGAENVPLYPASHGCVRINQSIAKYFQSLIGVGEYVWVWGHDGKDPEGHSERERQPSFNYPDPTATTTTSTSVPSDTTAPASTPSTTKPPSTTAPTTAVPTTTAPPTTPPPTTVSPTTSSSPPTT